MAPGKATQNQCGQENFKGFEGCIISHTMGDRTNLTDIHSPLKRCSQLLHDYNFLSRLPHKVCSPPLPPHISDRSGDRKRGLQWPLLFALRGLISVHSICGILDSQQVPPFPTYMLTSSSQGTAGGVELGALLASAIGLLPSGEGLTS